MTSIGNDPRVLHAPLNYADQVRVIDQALRTRGLKSSTLFYRWREDAPQYYDDDVNHVRIDPDRWISDQFEILQRVLNSDNNIIHFWNRSFFYTTGDSVFNSLDLPILKASGFGIVYRFTGYELRRPTIEKQINPYSPLFYNWKPKYKESSQEEFIEYLRGFADRLVVQDPEMQTYLPDAALVPRAIHLTNYSYEVPRKTRKPLVVHAPTNAEVKGTKFVEAAVASLREERGVNFEYKAITGMRHEDAMDWYRRADIIIDQLHVGWYGVLSMEGMALGKTVICYIRDDLHHTFGDGLPLLHANPDTITDVLRRAIKDADLRQEMGKAARAYVEKVHDSEKIAAAWEQLYRQVLESHGTPARGVSMKYHARQGEAMMAVIKLARTARQQNMPPMRAARLDPDQSTGGRESGQSAAVAASPTTRSRRDPEKLREHANRFDKFTLQLQDLQTKADAYKRLEPLVRKADAYRRLRRIPGIGLWLANQPSSRVSQAPDGRTWNGPIPGHDNSEHSAGNAWTREPMATATGLRSTGHVARGAEGTCRMSAVTAGATTLAPVLLEVKADHASAVKERVLALKPQAGKYDKIANRVDDLEAEASRYEAAMRSPVIRAIAKGLGLDG